MRFAAIIGGVVAAIVGCLLLIGVFIPESQFEVNITVNKPAKKVFEVFNDTSNLRYWIDGYQKMELLDGELGKNGARYVMTVKNGDVVHQFTQNTVTVKPAEYCEFFMTADNFSSRISVRFTSNGPSTHIRMITFIKGRDVVSKAFIPLMIGTIQAQEQKHYNQLRDYIERQ